MFWQGNYSAPGLRAANVTVSLAIEHLESGDMLQDRSELSGEDG
jgi:hypothetical protein